MMEVRVLQDQGPEPREPQTGGGGGGGAACHVGVTDKSVSRLILLDVGDVTSEMSVAG